MVCEHTWTEVTTPNEQGRCLIEGEVGPPDDAWRQQVLERLEDTTQWPEVEFVVFVQCLLMDSSRFGIYNVVVGGPTCTWTAAILEEIKADPVKHCYITKDNARLYPRWYITRAKHLETKGQLCPGAT